jgi:uncharacterized protein involved in exopolysaccharide biosynthesis
MSIKEVDELGTSTVPKVSEEASLVESLIVVAKNKRMIAGVTAAAGLAALLVSFVIPNVYLATARLLPPQQAQSSAAALLSQIGGIAGAAAGAAGVKSPNDLYVGMLKSRTVADRMIDKFKLKQSYDTEFYEVARRNLANDTSVESGKDGIIEINVQAADKRLAVLLANGYVDELTKLTKTLAITEASQRRLFFERELATAKNKLAEAETKLKGGLETKGMVSIEADSRALAETTGRLRAQVSVKEIELNSMSAFVTESNSEFLRVKQQLSSLRAELSKLENGEQDAGNNAAARQDKRGLENIQVLRDVKYYQMLSELLAKQYEAARLDEAKDSAIVQVLDPAIEPERRFKPKRGMIVAIAALLGFFASIGLAFFKEAKARGLQSPEDQARWKLLIKYLRFR